MSKQKISKREIVSVLNDIADTELIFSHRTSEVIQEAAKRIVIDDADQFIAWLYDNRFINMIQWKKLSDLSDKWRAERDGDDA